jgi:hypothetical protein
VLLAPLLRFSARGMSVIQFQCSLAVRIGVEHTSRMADGYRVSQAEDGTFPVELWSSKGGRERLIYKTRGFSTRELAEAWMVPVEVPSNDPSLPRSRVVYLKPRRSPTVIISGPNPPPPRASQPRRP